MTETRYHTVLFDLDGTLIDSGKGITRCARHALLHFGIDRECSQLRPFVGPPLAYSFMEFANLSREEAEEAIRIYRERYRDKGIYENEVYDGIPEILDCLREAELTLAVATSKAEPYAKQILDICALSPYFQCVTGSEFDGRRTDKGEVIEETMRRLNLRSKDADGIIMVGDRKFDAMGARQNGIACIGAAYGYAPPGELDVSGFVSFAGTPYDLPPLIL